MRKLSALVASAVLVAGVVAYAPAADAVPVTAPAVSASPAPTVEVHPSHGLVVGAPVTVYGHQLPPHLHVNVVECYQSTFNTDGLQGCPTVATATVSSIGTVTVHLAVQDPVYYQGEAGDPYPVYCRADQCRYFIEWTDASNIIHSYGTPIMFFHGSPASITATPTTGLVDGEQVHVSGTAPGSSGHSVVILEESCYELVQGSGCNGPTTLATLPLAKNGTFSGLVRVSLYLADGEDCNDTGFGCSLVAEVLNSQGLPDDSFGVSSLGRPGVAIDIPEPAAAAG